MEKLPREDFSGNVAASGQPNVCAWVCVGGLQNVSEQQNVERFWGNNPCLIVRIARWELWWGRKQCESLWWRRGWWLDYSSRFVNQLFDVPCSINFGTNIDTIYGILTFCCWTCQKSPSLMWSSSNLVQLMASWVANSVWVSHCSVMCPSVSFSLDILQLQQWKPQHYIVFFGGGSFLGWGGGSFFFTQVHCKILVSVLMLCGKSGNWYGTAISYCG